MHLQIRLVSKKLNSENTQKINIILKNKEKIPLDNLIFQKYCELNRKIHKLEKLLPETSCQRHHDFQLDDLDIDNASEKILDHLKFLIEEGYLSLGKEFKDTTDKIKILREKYDNVIREEIKLTHSKIKLVIFF